MKAGREKLATITRYENVRVRIALFIRPHLEEDPPQDSDHFSTRSFLGTETGIGGGRIGASAGGIRASAGGIRAFGRGRILFGDLRFGFWEGLRSWIRRSRAT